MAKSKLQETIESLTARIEKLEKDQSTTTAILNEVAKEVQAIEDLNTDSEPDTAETEKPSPATVAGE